MGLLRILAFVLFLFAGLEAKGWLLTQNASNALALIAFGLAAYVLSGIAVPSVPARGA